MDDIRYQIRKESTGEIIDTAESEEECYKLLQQYSMQGENLDDYCIEYCINNAD